MTNALMRSSMRAPLISFQEFDRLFDEFFPQVHASSGFPEARVNYGEDLIIQFALAGYPEDHLSVEVTGDCITVTGKKVESGDNLHAGKAFTWKRREVSGNYDLASAEVKYDNGLLTIKAPQREESKPKRLEIK